MQSLSKKVIITGEKVCILNNEKHKLLKRQLNYLFNTWKFKAQSTIGIFTSLSLTSPSYQDRTQTRGTPS